MKSGIRIAIGQFSNIDEETANFAKQLGIKSIQFNTPNIPGEKTWEYKDLLHLKQKCDNFGLKLEIIENVPLSFYNKVILGSKGKDEQIENYIKIIKNVGKVGIPILGHHFVPTFVWRTSLVEAGRGGSKVSEFDFEIAKKGINALSPTNSIPTGSSGATIIELAKGASIKLDYISHEELFKNYKYFMNSVLPIAEEYGVKLSLHPDDPPIKELGGIARLITNPEDYKKAMEVANSDAWGATLCLGVCSAMGGSSAVKELIRYFGEKKKIAYVHFRDVKGTASKFKECFLGEGNFNPAEIMLELKKVGFEGIVMDDHVPHIVNDTPWGHRARAYEIGYLEGLITMMEELWV